MKLHLSIVTPEGPVFDSGVREVVAPGLAGEIGLLPGHVPLVSAIRAGTLTVIDETDVKRYFAITAGFVEIDQDRVTILAATCEEAKSIDLTRARAAFTESSQAFAKLSPEDAGYFKHEARMGRAQARLDTAARAGVSG